MKKWLEMILLCFLIVIGTLPSAYASEAADQPTEESMSSTEEGTSSTEEKSASSTEESTSSTQNGKIDLHLKSELVDSKYIKLSWDKQQGMSYEISRAEKKSGSYKTIARMTKTSYKDRTAKEGSVYYYRLRTVENGRTGEWSAPLQCVFPLQSTRITKVLRYSSTSLRVEWEEEPNAVYYKVYRSKKKNGGYKQVAVTSGLHYRDKRLKKDTTYYYKVQACISKGNSAGNSALSQAAGKKTKTYDRTTVFAGDSLMVGVTCALKSIDIGGSKKGVAYKGLGTMTFQTRSVFGGKTGVEKVLSYKPYRVYLMLGMNEIFYRGVDDMLDNYVEIIETLREESPDTDIVLLATSPVSKAEERRRPGFKKIAGWNKKIEKLAEKYDVHFYDYTADYTDADGYLIKKYNGGDGIHWNMKGYTHFGELIEKYDKSLD